MKSNMARAEMARVSFYSVKKSDVYSFKKLGKNQTRDVS